LQKLMTQMGGAGQNVIVTVKDGVMEAAAVV
jgi:hypothetical protein